MKMLKKVCGLLVLLLIATVFPYGNGNQHHEQQHSRVKRGFNPWGFFETVFSMGRIIKDQYNETVVTLNQVYDVLADGFTDVSTKNPPPAMDTTTASPDGSTTTTTERYRISRYELGRILNRNYRGLKKLFRIEWNDALNQSQYNINDYHRDVKNAIANYAEFKNESKT